MSTFKIIDMMVVCLNIKLLISHSVLQMYVSVIAYEVEKDLRWFFTFVMMCSPFTVSDESH